MAIPIDTHCSDPLAVAVDEALTGETRKGSLLAIAGCFLYFAFQILNTLIDLSTKHQYPAFFRYPAIAIAANIGGPLISIPLYLIAMRSKRPLFWCIVCVVLDTLWVSELKFFWVPVLPDMYKLPFYLNVRYEDIGAFLMLLAIYALPLSRRLIVWSAALMGVVWSLGIAYDYVRHPGGSLYFGPFGSGIGEAGLRAFMNPEALPVDFFVIQLLLLAVFAWFVTLAIGQGRQFVVRRVRADADTASLRRFFPPTLAERIAAGGADDLAPARRHVAILFVNLPATNELTRIRSDYLRFEKAVFAHGGVIDRFSGGPAMAAFGAIGPDGQAEAKAVACVQSLGSIFAADGRHVSLSLHAGDAVCGNLGGVDSRAFSIVGDVVNTARRMLDVAAADEDSIVVSGAVLAAVPSAGAAAAKAVDLGEIRLRGRDAPLHLWRISP